MEGPPFHHGGHDVRDSAREGSQVARRNCMPATLRTMLRGEGAPALLPRGPQHPPDKAVAVPPPPPAREPAACRYCATAPALGLVAVEFRRPREHGEDKKDDRARERHEPDEDPPPGLVDVM